MASPKLRSASQLQWLGDMQRFAAVQISTVLIDWPSFGLSDCAPMQEWNVDNSPGRLIDNAVQRMGFACETSLHLLKRQSLTVFVSQNSVRSSSIGGLRCKIRYLAHLSISWPASATIALMNKSTTQAQPFPYRLLWI